MWSLSLRINWGRFIICILENLFWLKKKKELKVPVRLPHLCHENSVILLQQLLLLLLLLFIVY